MSIRLGGHDLLDIARQTDYFGGIYSRINVFLTRSTAVCSGRCRGEIYMKVKTSVTLSEELIREIDALSSQYGTRSALIERAVRDFLATAAQRQREARDLEILNRRAEALNAEAADVLSYQVEL